MSGAATFWCLARSPMFAVGLAISAVFAVTLFYFPPALYHFYPTCPIWSLFHVQCPGCGSTRALAALLHGRIQEAMRFNPLTVCVLPIMAGYAGYRSTRRQLGYGMDGQGLSRMWLYVGSAIMAVFTLLRNL